MNSKKYHFSDFTENHYRYLLQLAKKQYDFTSYHSIEKITKHRIYWRHDVDFSLHRARSLAEIEAEEGVKATYFLLLHSEFYNLLEAEITQCVRDIIDLGHDIGLHFDPHYYNVTNTEQLEQWLIFEQTLLQKLFNVPVRVFSFHITNPWIMAQQQEQYAGIINTYSHHFQHHVRYCSDSNGYWRFDRLEDVLLQTSERDLQVLTHPSLWQTEPMAPRRRIVRAIEGRANKTLQWYDNILAAYGRENIDEE